MRLYHVPMRVITLDNGEQVDLLAIQRTLNEAFQEHGEQKYADAANELAKVTRQWQGPHGEFTSSPDEPLPKEH